MVGYLSVFGLGYLLGAGTISFLISRKERIRSQMFFKLAANNFDKSLEYAEEIDGDLIERIRELAKENVLLHSELTGSPADSWIEFNN